MSLKDYENIESTNIEYKEIFEEKKPKTWLKTVSAFANTKGGIIIYGVRDYDKKAVGIESVSEVSEKITECINSRIVPLPRYELNSFKEDGMDFIVINVGDGPDTPYMYSGDGRKTAYIRAGSSSLTAPEHILNNLILKGKNKTYDCISSGNSLKEVSFTLLNATWKKETGTSIIPERDYLSFNLLDENGFVTNAGLLISDQGILKQSRIFCTKWTGKIKGAVEGDAIDDKEYTGSIISMLESAETFIKNNSKNSWKIDGMHRREFEDYPTKAIREALVNAIIHRDYQLLGSEIHIDLYEDRLEITSPGGMVDGSQIQNWEICKIPSLRRNAVIADIFGRLHFMDRRGSGLTRIMEAYDECERKPSFISTTSTFTVTFPNRRYLKENEEVTNIAETHTMKDKFILTMYKKFATKVRGDFLKNLESVFDVYGYEKEFSRVQIEEQFGVKKTRALEIIKQLDENLMIVSVDDNKYKFIKNS